MAYDSATRACHADEVIADLDTVGLTAIRRYGIRSVCDLIVDDVRKFDLGFYGKLKRLELALTAHTSYIHTARFFRILATLHITSCCLPARHGGRRVQPP